jgi:hypothetical protein
MQERRDASNAVPLMSNSMAKFSIQRGKGSSVEFFKREGEERP